MTSPGHAVFADRVRRVSSGDGAWCAATPSFSHAAAPRTNSVSTQVSGADQAHEVVDDLVGRDVLALAGGAVLDLDDTVGQALADHHDRRARRSARRP